MMPPFKIHALMPDASWWRISDELHTWLLYAVECSVCVV